MMGSANVESIYSPIWWNVVFLEREFENWWDIFSPKWARHVLCYGFCVHLDAWLIVNPLAERTLVEVVPDWRFGDYLDAWTSSGATILRIEARPAKPSAGRIVHSCSAIVGRIIGVNSAWRPMALFRSLTALGAEVRHKRHEHQGKRAEA